MRVEAVWGKLDEETSSRLVEFWRTHGALDEAKARERLSQVVCVLYDDDEQVAGVNSVYKAEAPLIGRPFWIYRRFLAPGVDSGEELAMMAAAYEALAPGFSGGAGEPLGVCAVISGGAFLEANPEAIWPEADFTFAGYHETGAQVRIRYFEGAMV